jgi:hypothetical protein
MAGHTDAHTSVAAEPPEARAAARALEAWKGHAEYYRLKAEGWGRAAAGLQRQLDEARRELVTYDKHAEADIARLMSERDEARAPRPPTRSCARSWRVSGKRITPNTAEYGRIQIRTFAIGPSPPPCSAPSTETRNELLGV